MEIFLLSGKTYLLAFESKRERDTTFSELLKMDLPNLVAWEDGVVELTKKW